MTTSLTFDRTSLGLPDLVITGEAPAGAGFFITRDGLGQPAFDVRATYAPDSAYVGGSVLLAAVLSASTLPVTVCAQAPTAAGLAVLKAELEAAAFQFTYPLTLTLADEPRTWDAGPAWPAWSDTASEWVGVNMARAALAIPVNPGA